MTTYLYLLFILFSVSLISSSEHPCCSYPCQNKGVCLPTNDNGYTCDCFGTDHSGVNCTETTFFYKIRNFFKIPVPFEIWVSRRFEFIWNLISSIKFLHRTILAPILTGQIREIDPIPESTGLYEYHALDMAYDFSDYSRILPPIPHYCKLPMGVGPKKLPDEKEVFDKLFKRREFIPNGLRSNVLFLFFAQHFTHQLFQSSPEIGLGKTFSKTHQIDMNQIYSHEKSVQKQLRTFVDGKFKMVTIKGEEYPLYIEDTELTLSHFPVFSPRASEDKYALGHPFFTWIPGLVVLSTVWMREHNRICDVLKKENPFFDDEQLFQTARLILIAINANIVLEDYVQHLSGFKIKLVFDPTIIENVPSYGSNRVRLEYNQLYHWHGLIPDYWYINHTKIEHKDFYGVSSLVTKYGISEWIRSMSYQPAGEVSRFNFDEIVAPVIIETIKLNRAMRIRPLNEYRKYFGLKAHTSFLELSGGNKEVADLLNTWYEGDINAVEMFVGFWAEPVLELGLTPETVTVIGASHAIFGLFTLPIASPNWWKPSTFGGKVGWDIIQNTHTFKDLVCRNVVGECPSYVSFKFPDDYTKEKYEL